MRLLASLLLATSLPAMAQIYMYTDAQGNPTFTSEAPPAGVNAQTISLPPTNTADAPPPANNYSPPATPAPAATTSQSQTDGSADNSADGDDTQYYDPDDEDYRARAAAVDAAVPGVGPVVDPARVGTPAINPAEPGPDRVEEPGIRR